MTQIKSLTSFTFLLLGQDLVQLWEIRNKWTNSLQALKSVLSGASLD